MRTVQWNNWPNQKSCPNTRSVPSAQEPRSPAAGTARRGPAAPGSAGGPRPGEGTGPATATWTGAATEESVPRRRGRPRGSLTGHRRASSGGGWTTVCSSQSESSTADRLEAAEHCKTSPARWRSGRKGYWSRASRRPAPRRAGGCTETAWSCSGTPRRSRWPRCRWASRAPRPIRAAFSLPLTVCLVLKTTQAFVKIN